MANISLIHTETVKYSVYMENVNNSFQISHTQATSRNVFYWMLYVFKFEWNGTLVLCIIGIWGECILIWFIRQIHHHNAIPRYTKRISGKFTNMIWREPSSKREHEESHGTSLNYRRKVNCPRRRNAGNKFMWRLSYVMYVCMQRTDCYYEYEWYSALFWETCILNWIPTPHTVPVCMSSYRMYRHLGMHVVRAPVHLSSHGE